MKPTAPLEVRWWKPLLLGKHSPGWRRGRWKVSITPSIIPVVCWWPLIRPARARTIVTAPVNSLRSRWWWWHPIRITRFLEVIITNSVVQKLTSSFLAACCLSKILASRESKSPSEPTPSVKRSWLDFRSLFPGPKKASSGFSTCSSSELENGKNEMKV